MNYPDGMRHYMLDGNTPEEDFSVYMEECLLPRLRGLADELSKCEDEADEIANAANALHIAAAYIAKRYGV